MGLEVCGGMGAEGCTATVEVVRIRVKGDAAGGRVYITRSRLGDVWRIKNVIFVNNI